MWRASLLRFCGWFKLPYKHWKCGQKHAHGLLTHTQTFPNIVRLLVICSFVGGYRSIIWLYGLTAPLPYLLYNQAWLQNNLIPPTGTLSFVAAMSARCPTPWYNFTPLYHTESISYLMGIMEMHFSPVIDQQHLTDDLNILPSCSGHSRFMEASTGTASLFFINFISRLCIF